ncbi:MAG: hypothetical protein RLY58_483 [Pseudomonadota bacterium]|jgi:uncharacterized repeat protein (TIGR01451 family)
MHHAIRPFFPAIRTKQTALALMLAACSSGAFAYSIPAPGDRITNIASGDFQDAYGNVQVINSNPVELTITEVRALSLVRDQQQNGLIGGQISYPHVLTNSGNVRDTYLFSITQKSSDDFDLNGLAVYADRNQDGIPDDNLNLLQGNTITLDAGQSLAVVVSGSIPNNRSNGNSALFDLTATSQTGITPPSATVTDTTTVTTGAVIAVTKSQSVSTGPSGTFITYTLRYNNTGNSAGELQIDDTLLDAEALYVGSSGLFSNGSGALTDANDVEAAANSAVTYQSTDTGPTHVIAIRIPAVPAQSTGSVSFRVQVVSANDGTIDNTATYRQYDGGSLIKTSTSNTVSFVLQGGASVVLNTNAATASNTGNPASAPDNLLTVASTAAGTEVLFDDYIWNTGSSTDIFNLSTVVSNLPSCATVKLYAADGRTLLTDSNGDGVIDSGPLAINSNRHIRVGISSTQSCVSSGAIQVDLTARSVNDPSIQDPVRNTLGAITQANTDLYNRDLSGQQPQGTDNAGAAFVTKSTAPAQSVVFPLTIQNLGTQTNNYNLFVDDDGTLDSSNNSNDLPSGWQVHFFAASQADCSALGAEITNSGNVAPNGTVNYCAVVTPPAGLTPMTTPLWFAIRSPVNGQSDLVKDQVTITAIRQLTLTPDNQGQVGVGGTVVYSHVLTNMGTLTEGASVGQLIASLDNSHANGLVGTLYYDANNNGTLDAADPQMSDIAALGNTPSAGGAIGLSAGESIRLLVKVEANTALSEGLSGTFVLTITAPTLLNGQALASLSNTDLTTIGSNQLRLKKEQALDADCVGGPEGGYVLNPIQIKPNQCVFYHITAVNEGSEPVNNVVIADTVPAFTKLSVPTAPSVTQGSMDSSSAAADGAIGPLKANVGTLTSGASATLQFKVRVQP